VAFKYFAMLTVSVTTLKRQATELLDELERSRDPMLITRRGLPSAYLVDVASYVKMQVRMRLFEGICRGERAILDGRTVTHAQAKRRSSRWLK
jgi:prevent-host-death family protein